MPKVRGNGFTLIEVLLALVIIAVALTALLKASSHNIVFTQNLKHKTITHWVAMQAISAIQSGLIEVHPGEVSSHVTHMFNKSWYWKAELKSTSIQRINIIKVAVSQNPTGQLSDTLYAYKYSS